MTTTLTARYVKTSSGYMGQIIEWPEVVTEGEDLEACRASLKDALREMMHAYQELGKEVPSQHALFEPVTIESA
jgi:predicted RNase H-like HicB family nuclease